MNKDYILYVLLGFTMVISIYSVWKLNELDKTDEGILSKLEFEIEERQWDDYDSGSKMFQLQQIHGISPFVDDPNYWLKLYEERFGEIWDPDNRYSKKFREKK